MKNVLTIAGYDPSSGAGIVRDMDTFFSLGIHGLSIPTCTVVQGPHGVTGIYPTPIKLFKEMVAHLGRQLPFHGVKVGVGCDSTYIREITGLLKKKNIPLVIDPVMAAKNGTELISEAGLRVLTKSLFARATIVTPNIAEASRLCGTKITTIKDMEEAARMIMTMGPRAVIIKGGHLKGDPVDIFCDGRKFEQWKKKRINREVHGTGCSFSALIISFLVLDHSLKDAFFAAEELMEETLNKSYRIDKKGYFYMSTGITNHLKLIEKRGQ
jgi:hydroxymethylpyrimidine kinase/phosphomethylpyrimidine kinase